MLEGNRASACQIYPPEFCHAVCKEYAKCIRRIKGNNKDVNRVGKDVTELMENMIEKVKEAEDKSDERKRENVMAIHETIGEETPHDVDDEELYKRS